MQYFVIRPNYWGFSDNSLYEAMKNCGIVQESKLETLCELLSHVGNGREASACLKDGLNWKDWESNCRECEFTLALIPEGWKLASVSEVDGGQSWEWEGPGEAPPFNPVKLKLATKADGTILLR